MSRRTTVKLNEDLRRICKVRI